MPPWLVVQDQADGAANAAADTGSFSRLTHAAEFYASQAATQAAGLFSYKKSGDEKSQEPKCVLLHECWGQLPKYMGNLRF